MNLYIYDEKHEQIIGSMPIIHQEQAELIVQFLEEHGFSSHYHKFVIARDYVENYDFDGNKEIEFIQTPIN